MKRPYFWIIVFISLLLMSSCVSSGSSPEKERALSSEAILQAERQKPRIPKSQDLKASVLKSDSEEDTKKLLEAIEAKIQEPTILYQDLERGWYYGGVDEKKLGTPSTWGWVEDGPRSRWVSPNALEETEQKETEALCKKTAGTYRTSCLETASEGCEYIPESRCECIEGSRWHKTQGCLLSQDEAWVEITPEELQKGWYQGLPNQKKLNTPPQWRWVDRGLDSRWQNPNPIN